MSRSSARWLLTLALGCGPQVQVGDPGEGSTSGEASTSEGVGEAATGLPPGSTEDSGDDTSGGDTGPGRSFIDATDYVWSCPFQPGVVGLSLCDVWSQDCAQGTKCLPAACDDANTWGTTKCSPIVPDPDPVGATCTAEGSGTSGQDTCELGAMCWNVDPQTLEGRCVAICHGTANNPVCPAGQACSIFNGGLIALCLPECDPLDDDACDDGLACQPNAAQSAEGFVCRPTQASGQLYDACHEQGGCPAGQVCATRPLIEPCDGGCCTPLCDLDDPGETCTGVGALCLPWFDDGDPPPHLANVGVCWGG